MNIYFQILSSFAKISAFTFGGGFAMIPVIEREVVGRRKWITGEEFLDMLAISQSTPGLMAINLSIFIGDRLKGIKGGIVAAFGTALPSFLIILALAISFNSFKDNETVASAFKAIRPAVVALIAVPVISLSKAAKINIYTAAIPIVSVLLIVFLNLSPIWLIIAGAILGMAHLYISVNSKKRTRKNDLS